MTLSRKDHICAQTRELACTKLVLPQVIGKSRVQIIKKLFTIIMYYTIGLNVVEVAHDNAPSVKAYIVQELNLINSYDTWHGKNLKEYM